MKKIYLYFLSLLSLFWFLCLVVFISEPSYFYDIIRNTKYHQSFDEYEKSLNLVYQPLKLGNVMITNNTSSSYVLINIKELIDKPLTISVVTWNISYHLFGYNKNFNSIFSPSKMMYIDNATNIASWDNNFDCIKIENHQIGIDTPDKCKDIPTFEDRYPDLRLEIYSRSWTIINFQQ